MLEHHSDVRFERTDVKTGPIAWFIVILGAALVGIMGLLWSLQGRLLDHEESLGRARHSMAVTAHDQLPPAPRIEGVGLASALHSVNDPLAGNSIARQRAKQEAALRDGWTDSGGGRHPPFVEAMKIFLAKIAAPKPAQTPEGLAQPGDSSAGRKSPSGGHP